jgi:undecaprenyl-diphosphatase
LNSSVTTNVTSPALYALGTLTTAVSFAVAYASIAWLLRFVAKHTLMTFVWYRLAFGTTIIVLLTTGVITAT